MLFAVGCGVDYLPRSGPGPIPPGLYGSSIPTDAESGLKFDRVRRSKATGQIIDEQHDHSGFTFIRIADDGSPIDITYRSGVRCDRRIVPGYAMQNGHVVTSATLLADEIRIEYRIEGPGGLTGSVVETLTCVPNGGGEGRTLRYSKTIESIDLDQTTSARIEGWLEGPGPDDDPICPSPAPHLVPTL